MGGGTKKECSFCRKPFRVKSRRKSDPREDSVEEAKIPENFSNFARVSTHFGTEVAEAEGGRSVVVHRMFGECFEIVAEVERIQGEIERLKGMLEVAMGKLRRIVGDSKKTREEGAFQNVEEMEVIEPKQEWLDCSKAGGDRDDPSYSTGFDENDVSSNEEMEVVVKRRRMELVTEDPLASEGGGSEGTKRTQRGGKTCEFCLKKMTLSQLPKHLTSHLGGNEEYLLHCLNPSCKAVFLSVVKLGLHVDYSPNCRNSTESLQTPLFSSPIFTCEVCGFHPQNPCGMTAIFRNHLNVHEVELPKIFSCPVEKCEKTFGLKQSVQHHLAKHQGKEKEPESLEEDLEPPKQRQRTKRYPCLDCGKAFFWPKMLANHLAKAHPRNPEIRPFACEVEGCGKAFYDQKSLDGHKKGSHPEVRPVCEVCGMTFANQNTLRIHKLVHTGERQHACEICGQRFRHRVTLTTHLRSHAEKGDRFKPGGEMRERKVLRRTKTEIELEAKKGWEESTEKS